MTSLCFTLAYMVGKGAQTLYMDVKQKREEKKRRKAIERGEDADELGIGGDVGFDRTNAAHLSDTEIDQRNLGLSSEGRACISARSERPSETCTLSGPCIPYTHGYNLYPNAHPHFGGDVGDCFASLDGAVHHLNITSTSPNHSPSNGPTSREALPPGYEPFIAHQHKQSTSQAAAPTLDVRGLADPPPRYERDSAHSSDRHPDPHLPPYQRRSPTVRYSPTTGVDGLGTNTRTGGTHSNSCSAPSSPTGPATSPSPPPQSRSRASSITNSLRKTVSLPSLASISSIIKPKPQPPLPHGRPEAQPRSQSQSQSKSSRKSFLRVKTGTRENKKAKRNKLKKRSRRGQAADLNLDQENAGRMTGSLDGDSAAERAGTSTSSGERDDRPRMGRGPAVRPPSYPMAMYYSYIGL
ncbi:hypothetical protein CVT24_004189 [Panaeolus cyanescens]|uniref:Uncharacterized protein n=1 Tax=Panaeolus cyanescens TaxID=181874 RepID=A0A409W7U9_9AGAR|nr:hypothetical protein CVT24_004189 [Panaeolus cyanescens]